MPSPWPASESLRRGTVFRALRLSLLGAVLLLFAPGCNGFFYFPTRDVYERSKLMPTEHEDVWFESGDGTKLHGWFLPGKGAVRGTVVHFHGNGANLTNHISFVAWLAFEGFNVFTFDYRGYGQSEGSASREGVHQDALAALNTIRAREDVDPDRLVVLGQSLGGAVALAALGEGGRVGVRGVAVESTFLDYQEVANGKIGGTCVTWPLAWLLVGGDHSPADSLEALGTLPKLVIHGDDDPVVGFENGERLFEALSEPKLFLRVNGGGHIQALRYPGVGRPLLVEFFSRCLGVSPERRELDALDAKSLQDWED